MASATNALMASPRSYFTAVWISWQNFSGRPAGPGPTAGSATFGQLGLAADAADGVGPGDLLFILGQVGIPTFPVFSVLSHFISAPRSSLTYEANVQAHSSGPYPAM